MFNTDFVWNLFLIGIIIFAILVVGYRYFHREGTKLEEKTILSYHDLLLDIKQMLNDYTSINVFGMGLTEQAVLKQETQRRNISHAIRTCCSGNSGSRSIVKDLIYGYLGSLELNETTIEYIIPFQQPSKMSARQQLETMIYMRDKNDEIGFLELHKTYNFIRATYDMRGNARYEVSEADIREMYAKEQYMLSRKDKQTILTQLLFADAVGLGVIDSLNHQKGCVEEIQLGMSGLQQYVYDYKKELLHIDGANGIRYSKDAIHVIISGVNIWLSFLSFPTESEMQRVLLNLIKDSSAGELTIKQPIAIVESVDGRRITVARPPTTDCWVGLIRKFDTLPVTDFDTMYNEKQGADKVNDVIRQIIRSGCNVGFTGEMSSGKTSLFRCALTETRPDLSIRIIESGSFELDARKHLPERNTLAMRVTEQITEQEIMGLIRKSTGQIFCIGEINSLAMANLTMDLARISQQTLFSAHYATTDSMVQDLVAAKICIGGFSDEKLAEMEAVRSLQFDVHIRMVHGLRYIQYINEIVPEFDFERGYDTETITKTNAMIKTAEGLREVRQQLGKTTTYSVRKILEFDEKAGKYKFYHAPSTRCYEKARWYMTEQQYKEFSDLFERICLEDRGGCS